MKYKNETIEISLADLFGYLFSKWKTIIVFIIIGVILGVVYYFIVSSQGSSVNEVSPNQVDEARDSLTAEQIAQVDYLYAQYLSYKEYRVFVQNYLTDSLYSESDFDNNIICTSLYYVESGINNVNQVFARLAVSSTEYEAIAQVMGKDSTSIEDVYRRVEVKDISANLNDTTVGNSVIQNESNNEPSNALLQVNVIASNEEQADEVISIIEESFEQKLYLLRQIDEGFVFKNIDKQYSSNLQKYIYTRQTDAVNALNNAYNQINILQTNYIEKLSKEEKTYYNLLKQRDEASEQVTAKVSFKKCLLIGLGIGLVIAFICLIINYLSNGKVKIINDIVNRYDIDIPYVISRKKRGFQLFFGPLSRKCRGIDLSDEAICQDLVATDIGIKLEKDQIKKLYLVTDGVTDWERSVADRLKDAIVSRNNSLSLLSGNPLSNIEQLELFAGTQATILILQLNETKQNVVDKWIQLARRYNLNIIGAVVIQEC